jgi:replicative DNA helicase
MAMRAYPKSIESERALLGGLLQDPSLLADITETVKAVDFFRPDHAALFELMLEMTAASEEIDVVTLPQRMQREGRAERYGGIAYVVELPDHTPATANLHHYARVIREQSVLRKLITTSEGLAQKAFDGPTDLGSLIESAVKDFANLGQEHNRRSWEQISLILDGEIERIEQLSHLGTDVTGIHTGFKELDKMLAGMQRGDLLILAARPSMGKTALALNIAQNAALKSDVGVGIFSLEMARSQLVGRMVATHGRIDGSRLRLGDLTDEDWERLLNATDTLRRARIFIDDSAALSVNDVRARARKLQSECPEIGLIVVDYLQLMRGDGGDRQSRVQEVAEISRGLKALAKDLNVPVLALSQLSRAVEQRQDKRPMLSDLRESGSIEQDADVIMFIYRDEYYDKSSSDKDLAEVIVAKQRNGSTGTVKLVFQGKFTRFDNLAKEDWLVLDS